MYHSDLPDKFLSVRRHLGLTQENIAFEIGVTPEAYGKIERGKTRVTEERLSQISAALGLEPWQMIQLSADELILLLIDSPPALRSFLTLYENQAKGVFNNQEREAIYLPVSQVNGSQYCLAAHTNWVKLAGLSEEERSH